MTSQQTSLEKMVLDCQKLSSREKFDGKWEQLVEMFSKRLQLYKYGRSAIVNECKSTIGIEFYPNIKSQRDLIHQVMHLHLYLPQVFFNQTQFYEFGTALDNRYIFDRRNVGSILGMAFLGMVGFLALGFTIMGMIAGGVLGVMLGRYAGRRMKKTFNAKQRLLEFDIYTIRTRCYVKWAEERGKTYRNNLNFVRFIAEKLLLELKPALHFREFNTDQQPEIKKLMQKVATLFTQTYFIHALILSLKLAHEYLRILRILESGELLKSDIEEFQHFKEFRQELEVCLMKAIDNVMRPLQFLLMESNVKSKALLLIRQEAKNFLMLDDVKQLMSQYPDPQMRVSFIKMLAAKMKQPIRNDNIINYLKQQNFRDIERVVNEIELNQQEQVAIVVVQEQQVVASPIFTQVRQKSQMCGSDNELQPLQEDIPNSQQVQSPKVELRLKITKHPNLVFLESNQGDVEFSLLSSADIKQILEPVIQHRKSVYDDETQNKFDMFLNFYNEPVDTWECVTTKDNIFIYKSMKPGCGSVFLKGYSLIEGHDKEVVFNAVYLKDFRVKWDKIMQGFNIIKHERDDIDVMYYYVKPPVPIVTTREWVQRRVLRHNFPNEGQICLLFYSIEIPEQPIRNSPVRAHTEIAGYVFENIPSGTKITFISNNDIRGSIPKMLVNHASAKGPFGWFGNLRKACAQYKLHGGDLNKIVIK